jgi:hypothetical protein
MRYTKENRRKPMAATTTVKCTVVGLNQAGPDRVLVNFVEDPDPDAEGQWTGSNFNLNLSSADATGYFPGQKYTVAFTKVTI